MNTTRYVWVRGPRRPVAIALASCGIILLSLFAACDIRRDNEADITVINNTTGTLVTLQIKNNDSSTWGVDELRGIELAPGQSFVIRDVTESERYDIQATDREGFKYDVQRINVGFSDETVSLTDGDLDGGIGELTIINSTGVAWTNLYVMDRNEDSWGGSVFSMPTLEPGASVTVDRPIWERYSVRAESGNQLVFEVIDHNMNAKSKTLEISAAQQVTDGRITLINSIDYGNGGDNSIMAIFVRLTNTKNWGPDLLFDSVGNGDSRDLDMDPGTYDIRVVDVSGSSFEQIGVKVVAGWPAEVTITLGDKVP